ncbi:MAG: hypothetical protein HUU20_17390 [Pirellulales bacterium]|nr:hypothetical protein [Pirellulales bacterium]
MIEKELLEILVCPKSHEPLSVAEESLITTLNKKAAAKTLKNMAGQTVEASLEGGLVCEKERLLYPIIDGIPVMLVDEAIPLAQVGAAGPENS